ncbi:MAG TPA: bifunctional [glutamate--ammonia ligase]-adenylyl-L-tyrosine phosphorylase/[glutamate--ammonia-ligase] adenylyltransferase, partial [Candidatus Acidoferrum sp.]|nr:bifunctional [glutamate--ammonia ligase]-adenylyl-L-tyrosine phosphorylase/[glutamate--ammonia-ligase] adenylyltransferase [Candidatus Acidoferrum sp.]
MKKTDWQKIIKASADPARVKTFLSSFKEMGARPQLDKFSPESAQALAAVVSGSQYLGELLLANPELLSIFDFERLRFSRRAEHLQRDAEKLLTPKLADQDYAGALADLRRFKQRETLRIAARDLGRLSDMVEITRELSDLADVCLEMVLGIVWKQLVEKFGRPSHEDARGRRQPTAFCVLGLGKLGGQELNYSSDVDVMFLYEEEGEVFKGPTSARAVMSSHQFFCKLAEAVSDEVSRATADGFFYRVDLRLRPEGDSGPIARSLESCENYYAQWGQTWERMMLIKARRVAGDKGLAPEFLEMIQPFRFPRSVSPEILQEITATKERIENEVVRMGELERNVKLGRGGIREIEFTVQALQVLHAGRAPFLQISQTLPCLAKLAQYDLLAREDAMQLHAAYIFLRDLEHRLQMENNLQTHTVPEDGAAQLRLARLMNFATREKFQAALRAHTANVRHIYESLLKGETQAQAAATLPPFDGPAEPWMQLLAAHSFREPEHGFQLFKEFAEGPGYLHVSPRTTELARQLIPKFLALCPVTTRKRDSQTPVLSDPDRVLARLDSFIGAYGSRSALFELWNNNPKYFEMLLLLFDRSEFLAETAIRAPDLIDGLVAGGRLQRRKSAAEILKELRFGLRDADQFLWLRRYHETELMRLGLRDISGQVDIEQTPAELSTLADASLQYALEVVLQKNKIKSSPLAIIGLGKLGGGEITYGSDLDFFFVAGTKEKNLPRLQIIAAEVMDLLSRRTEQGIVFHTDTRLRPDGEKGLLVPTLDGCESYYRQRAQLWEIQALSRARFVAGNMAIGERFLALAAKLSDFSEGRYDSRFKDWKAQIHRMRMRIEKERTPAGKDDLAIKTGKGGLMDVEFIAQVLCMESGWHEPNTLRALERAREENILPGAEMLIENYRQVRRVEAILRRWSDEGETVLPDDAPAFYRVSVRCGFDSPERFRAALAKWRLTIRKAY